MTPSQAIAYFGSKSALAAALQISHSAVYKWEKHGSIPLDRQSEIEVRTSGALRADIPNDERGIAPAAA